MWVIFYCHRCGEKVECETVNDMNCDCGHSIKYHDDTRNHVNMRNTWSGTTQVEFTSTTMGEDIADRNSR